MGHQDAGVAAGLGVDADHRLAVEVLGHVGHQPVLADGDDHVLGGEEEPAEVATLDPSPAPIQRDGPGDGGQGVLLGGVAGLDLVEVAIAAT